MYTIEKVKRAESHKQGFKCKYDFRIRNRVYADQQDIIYTPPPDMTLKDAMREAERIRDDLEKSKSNIQRIKVKALVEEFNAFRKKRASNRTIVSDYKRLNRFAEKYGSYYADDITTKMIDTFITELIEGKCERNKTYLCKFDIVGYLKNNRFSKDAFARASGIPHTTLNAMINGDRVSYMNAEKLSKFIGQRIDLLFSSEGCTAPLSPKTVLNHLTVISSMMNKAMKWGYIKENPCKDVTKPKDTVTDKIKCFDDKQVEVLYKLLEEETIVFKTVIRFLVGTGLRREECLGLFWSDIDFRNKCVHIERALTYEVGKGLVYGPTKTPKSVRTVPIPDSVLKCLSDYRQYQDEFKERIGDRWNDNNVIFTSFYYKTCGKPVHPDTLSEWFREFMKRHKELPYITLHGLRHTYITQLIYNGVNIITVSRLAGHSSVQVTLNKYTHACAAMDRSAYNEVNKIF